MYQYNVNEISQDLLEQRGSRWLNQGAIHQGYIQLAN